MPSKCDFVDSAIKTQVYAHQSLNGGPVASIENEEGSLTDNRTLAVSSAKLSGASSALD